MNRYLTQFRLQFEKRVVDVYAQVTFGASGAPTLNAVNSKGVKSISRVSAGRYLVTFGTNAQLPVDTYVKLLCVKNVFDTTATAAAPAAPGMFVAAQALNVGTITIQFNAAGTATDPASGEVAYIDFCLGDSTAP